MSDFVSYLLPKQLSLLNTLLVPRLFFSKKNWLVLLNINDNEFKRKFRASIPKSNQFDGLQVYSQRSVAF